MAASGFFADLVLGPLRPPAQIMQWDRNAISPIGFRHWESGEYRADAKIGLVGGFTAQSESGRALDFGQVNAVDAGFLTNTLVLTFNLGEVNLNPASFFDQMVIASSVGTQFKAFNMKFWIGNLTAFTDVSGLPTPTFHFSLSSGWQQGIQINPGDPGVLVLPSSLPPSGNIFNETTDVFISGVYKDLEHSDFVYLRGQFPSGNFTLGTYGGSNQRDFTFRFTYDWTGIDARVLNTDLAGCSGT